MDEMLTCWPLQLPPSLKPPWQLFDSCVLHTLVPLVELSCRGDGLRGGWSQGGWSQEAGVAHLLTLGHTVRPRCQVEPTRNDHINVIKAQCGGRPLGLAVALLQGVGKALKEEVEEGWGHLLVWLNPQKWVPHQEGATLHWWSTAEILPVLQPRSVNLYFVIKEWRPARRRKR